MPVTDDQPVSVGNLNAVLGGGSSLSLSRCSLRSLS